jgi:hypothetical protein
MYACMYYVYTCIYIHTHTCPRDGTPVSLSLSLFLFLLLSLSLSPPRSLALSERDVKMENKKNLFKKKHLAEAEDRHFLVQVEHKPR